MVLKSIEEGSDDKISEASCFGKPGGGEKAFAALFFGSTRCEEEMKVPSPVRGDVIGEEGERTLAPPNPADVRPPCSLES
jgi:hypothetical protein